MLTRIALATFAIVFVLSSPGLAQTIRPVPPNSTSIASGKEMFLEYCAACHGQDAKGGGPAATALKKRPADLTQLSAHNGGKFPDNRVALYIEGQDVVASHGSRDMPVWGSIFRSMSASKEVTALRISNLTDYIRSLQAAK